MACGEPLAPHCRCATRDASVSGFLAKGPAMRRLLSVPLTLLVLAACQRAPQAPTPEAARRIEADLRFLASDRLEGRETGTRGYDLAADYVAARFRAIGLAPAGDNGSYVQAVPLLQATRGADGARLAIVRAGHSAELRFREQYLPALNFNTPAHRIEAPAVFVGQAVHAPELDHDDFAGLDLKGKIAVAFGGAPAAFDNDRRAFHSSSREKLRALAERGAVGVVWLNTADDEMRAPWARAMANWDRPGMRLRGADGRGLDTFPQLQALASVSAAATDAFFVGTGKTSAQLYQAAQAGTGRGFDLPGTLLLAGQTRIAPLQSHNVVAKLPGRDAARASEHLVYSAHLDHLGIGAAVDGDAIYNGALDNALGVSILLEAARELHDAQQAPKRSTLFVALTAEEKGLLGAEWFATHPPGAADLVANINMDMPVLLAPTRDVVPIGLEHSSLQGVVADAAQALGLALSPDPFPEEVVFVRSDQYAFIRAGIPAVYLDGGIVGVAQPEPGALEPKLALRAFLRHCYHQPCDDAEQPIQYADAARLALLNARIGRLAGDADQRPRWNAGDFFGQRFAGAAATGAPAPSR
jgi:Zn-dependent M28 family amino/carboxypeptidase